MRSDRRKIQHKDASVFFSLMYGATTYPWVRRQDNRFVVHPISLKEMTDIPQAEQEKMFKRLERIGWIYNYRRDVMGHRFSMRMPEWLAVSEIGKLTEKNVPKSRAHGEDTSDAPSTPPRSFWTGGADLNPFAKEREAKEKLIEERMELEIESTNSELPTPEELIG